MTTTRFLLAAILTSGASLALGQAPRARLNPIVELLERKQPVFGLYAPSNRRTDAPQKTPAELARETLAYRASDFVFDGSMEGGLERGLPAFADFVKAMAEAGALSRSPHPRLTHPLVVKAPKIGTDAAGATDHISRQLNLGVSGIVFVEVESADEVRRGLAAMRFKSKGGTRPDHVAGAPAYWGMSEKEYRAKADLWPLDPGGELVSWTIVESKEGLAHVREIATVKGISVLFPGAGTLRRVFTTTNASGERTFDPAGWEAAIQQVLAACKEFDVPCGYPANASDVELRMQQGFSVFISGWGEGGFKAIEIGRRAASQSPGSPPTRALDVQTASGTPLEELGRTQLLRILKTHDLERWIFTRRPAAGRQGRGQHLPPPDRLHAGAPGDGCGARRRGRDSQRLGALLRRHGLGLP